MRHIDESLAETTLHILTLSSTILPQHIMIGYEKAAIRSYIPTPQRCNNSYRLGQTFKACRNDKVCAKCEDNYHLNDEINETCQKDINCINCKTSKITSNTRTSNDKKCPIYIKQQEIIAIKTNMQVDNKTAYDIYKKNHSTDRPTYSEISKNTTPMQTILNKSTSPEPSTSVNIKPALVKLSPRVIDYSDLNDLVTIAPTEANKKPNSIKSKVQVLPRSLSKRQLKVLKSQNKFEKSLKFMPDDNSIDSSDNMECL